MLQDYQLLQSLLYICGCTVYLMMITELTTITSALQQQVSLLVILEDIILLCECNGEHIYKGLTDFKSKWHLISQYPIDTVYSKYMPMCTSGDQTWAEIPKCNLCINDMT